MSNISTFDQVKVETDEIEENGNLLGAEIILANGDEIVALDCSEETTVYKNEYDSTKKSDNITTCDFTGGYIVMLSDGSLKIIQAEELVNENIAISTESSLLETSHSPNGLEVLQAHFPCLVDGCNKKFLSSSQLKIHQRKHSGVSPHECDLCKKKFSTGYALKAHKRTHTGEKPYICPEATCQKRFKTSGDLQKHIRTHTGERPFKCGLCPKAFTTSNIRKVHMRVHTGEKPYSCTYDGCEKRFSSATNFRNHLRTHTGEKPYVCSFQSCQKRFAEYSSLYKHYTVHSQKKRFECSLCDRHYRQLSTLNIHMNTIHKDKVDEIYKKSEHKLPINRNNPTLYKPKDSDSLDDAKKEELFPSIADPHVVYSSSSPSCNKDVTINPSIDFEPLKAITCGSEAILVLAVPSECEDGSFTMGVEEKLP